MSVPTPAESPVGALPRVLLSAPASGAGKTMITTGLLAALRARGLEVSPHKVGPDYIDPGYHTAACGRRGRNLDAHMQDPDRIVPLLLHGATSPTRADVAVIEGVMGLFDGALGRRGFAGSAHVAQLTSTPVILVVDCASTAFSVGALVHGFATFSPDVTIGGVILNNVASTRHEREARLGVAEAGVPVLGVVPRRADVVVPSRHLGLVPAAERAPEAESAVAALAQLVGDHVDLDAVLDLARTAPDLQGQSWDPTAELQAAGFVASGARPRVAVAAGEAFTFTYAENIELLTAAGVEVAPFDPLNDTLPSDISGLVIGGGFPEVHAGRLSENTALRTAIGEFANNGGVVYAECAGLLYLARTLEDHPMCDVLPLTARMTPRLTLGYREAVALSPSALAREGQRVTGHEFHRTVVELDEAPIGVDADAAESTVAEAGADDADAAADTIPDSETRTALAPAWGWHDGDGVARKDGWISGNVHASYLHLHWAGAPTLAAAFAAAVGAGEMQ